MKSLFVIILLLAFTTACSSLKKPNSKIDQSIQHDQVDLGLEGTIPLHESAPVIAPNEETVRIGDRGGDIYSDSEAGELNQAVSRKLRVGLSLGPGLYRALNYVSLLKYLERQSLTPQLITGTDFGAIVAAMYAHGMTPEAIEWNFYRYFREKGNHRPYEEEWFEDLDRLLLDKFKTKNIQDANKKLYLTLYNAKTKKTYYFDKGNTRELLLKNFTFKKGKPGSYTAAFQNEVFNPKLMNRLGADFTIGADVLGNSFDFEDSSEFLVGIYGRAAGKISREKKGFDYFFPLPLTSKELDSTQNGASSLMKTQEYLDKQTTQLKKQVQLKMSANVAQ